MGLHGTIERDIVTAMKAGDHDTRDALRLVRGELEGIAKPGTGKGGHVPSEDEVLGAVKRVRDQLAETLSYQAKAGTDPARECMLRAQVSVLTSYLPAVVSDDDIAAAVKRVMADNGFTQRNDMGKAMALLKAELGVGADMGKVSAAVKTALGL